MKVKSNKNSSPISDALFLSQVIKHSTNSSFNLHTHNHNDYFL